MINLPAILADTACTADGYCTNLPTAPASGGNVQNLVHIVVATFAAVAVLIIIISALNIVTAGGDSAKVAKARSAIIFSLVGMAVIVSADLIVSLIVNKV